MFGLAWAFVAHTDSRFDPEMLCRFVRAYQSPAADDRRAVGGRDHAAHRAGREPEALGRADHEQPRRAAGGRRLADRLLGVDGTRAEPASAVLAEREARRLPTRSPCSSCSGCATRIPR